MEILRQKISNNEILQVLRNKSFFFLILSEFFSQIAFNMQNFVIIFIVYRMLRSNTAVSGIILAFTLPALFFSILAGVFVDQWNKKKVLFTTNVIRGVLLLFFLIPNLHISFIYLLTFLMSTTTQFFLPAESAIIPLLVGKSLLLPANAVFAVGVYSTILIGYIGSGPLLLFFGKTITFLGLSAFFFISSLCILLVSVPKVGKQSREDSSSSLSADSFFKKISEGFTFIKKAQRVMQGLIILTISQAILFTFAVLGPDYVTTILDVEVESLSWILLAPAAIGMMIGSVIVGSLGRRFRRGYEIGSGFLITGIMFLFLPYGSKFASQEIVKTLNNFLPHIVDITILHIIVFLAFIAGFANSFVFIPANSAVQAYTNEHIRGRIYGFLNALVGAVSLLPVVVAGALADLFGIIQVIIAIGIVLLIASVFFFVFSKYNNG